MPTYDLCKVSHTSVVHQRGTPLCLYQGKLVLVGEMCKPFSTCLLRMPEQGLPHQEACEATWQLRHRAHV